MEVDSDPIKAMEPGKAYDDLDLIADFLDGLKVESEGGPPDFTAEKRLDDLETYVKYVRRADGESLADPSCHLAWSAPCNIEDGLYLVSSLVLTA